MTFSIRAALVAAVLVVGLSGCGAASLPPAASEAVAAAPTPPAELPSPRSAAPVPSPARPSDAIPATIDARIPVGAEPAHLAIAADAVWVANGDGSVSRVDPGSATVTATTALPGMPAGIAGDDEGIWVAINRPDPGEPPALIRLDPATGAITKAWPLGEGPRGVAIEDGAVWVSSGLANAVTRVDVATGETQTIAVDGGPAGIRVVDGQVWVATRNGTAATRIDPETRSVAETVELGAATVWLAGTAGAIWLAGWQSPEVYRVDADTREVTTTDVGAVVYPGVATLNDAPWIPAGQGLIRLDPTTAEPTAQLDLASLAGDVEPAEDGGLWVLLPRAGELLHVQPPA